MSRLISDRRFVKHDFQRQPNGAQAERFLAWLEAETIEALLKTRQDFEGTKTAIFLFVNRAYEAHLSDEHIGQIFGICFVRAGRDEEEQDQVFDLLESFGQLAKTTHSAK